MFFIWCNLLFIDYSRKYVGIGQSYVLCAKNMLDSERGMAMKADALILLIMLPNPQGK